MPTPPKLRAILDAADKHIDAGQGIEHDEFWRRVEVKNADHRGNGAGKKKAAKR